MQLVNNWMVSNILIHNVYIDWGKSISLGWFYGMLILGGLFYAEVN